MIINALDKLKAKASWVWRETIKIHKAAPETRLASSLSDIEIFVTLYYGSILKFKPAEPLWEERDRFVVSKGHGGVSLYPILADLGFFSKDELSRVCKPGSLLGSIPDSSVPGFETVNGALGHGLGVACGMALGLKVKQSGSLVFVLSGDGELYEGSIWEAAMFAAHYKLHNLILIVDNNGISMLGYCKDCLNISPLQDKFRSFGWRAETVDGHDIEQMSAALKDLKHDNAGGPKVLIANTIKGRGVPQLEGNPLCHSRSLRSEEIDELLKSK